MWSGQMHAMPQPDPKLAMPSGTLGRDGLNWQQANDYCNSLQLAGFTSWRLPTLDEAKAVAVVGTTLHSLSAMDRELVPTKTLLFKGGILAYPVGEDGIQPDISDEYEYVMQIWTSTKYQSDPKSSWTVLFNGDVKGYFTQDMSIPREGVICVRSMEPDLLQTARAADVTHPVPDIQTLQTFIPLNKARLAYQAGNYQESITQVQTAISIKAGPATANWGIGISYGRLGQWDQAIANLQSALAIDKNFAAATTALKWAKDGLKAAKKGKLPKEPTPTWN
jgi:tetratricopeptide (TPR) repeat protein